MIVIIVLGIILFFWLNDHRPPVPKKTWIFVDNPDTVDTRIADGIIITPKTYKGYVTIPPEIAGHPIFTLDADRFRNLVCLWTLAQYGGRWIVPTKNSFVAYHSTKEFHGYYTKTGIHLDYMECIKGSAFIRAWRDEYSRLAEFPCVDRYLESRSVGSQKFIDDSALPLEEKYAFPIKDWNMDPMAVACMMILPEHVKNIELRT